MKIACLLDQHYEDSELRVPHDRLSAAGIAVEIVGRARGEELLGKRGHERVRADRSINEARAGEYGGVLIPGGGSPARLREEPRFVALVQAIDRAGKLVAAVCHGPQLLVAAGLVRGRTMTAWPSVQAELRDAGANAVDREVAIDRNLITSRRPEDLDAFCAAILDHLGLSPAAHRSVY